MPKACDLKKGHVVEINNEAYMVKHIDVRTPSARGAVTLYRVRFSSIKTKQKHEQTFKGGDVLEEIDLQRKPMQYLYPDGEVHVFMDRVEYGQYLVSAEVIEEEMVWLSDGMEEIQGLIIDDTLVGIEIPAALVFEITETAPFVKGASATARTKPATLSNGVEIQVPEYLETGQMVRVNTETRKFMARA